MAQLAAPDGGGLEWTQNPHTLWGGEARLTGGGGGWGGVGSEDEERSLRSDERRAGRGLGGAVASVSDATETRQTVSVCRVGRGGG
jgi:hypothetical protein